jgi:inorganic pyrophosphatase/exopolyphosphatase
MKIRRGFVSNSSSSSFVVAFPKKPENIAEMKELLFKDVKTYPSPYTDESWSTNEVAQIVFGDLKESLTDEQAIEELVNGYWGEFRHMHEQVSGIDDIRRGSLKDINQWREEYEKAWKVFDELQRNDAKRVIERLRQKYPDWLLFVFEYSDNDGDLMSALEHGNLFDLLPHEVVSHH